MKTIKCQELNSDLNKSLKITQISLFVERDYVQKNLKNLNYKVTKTTVCSLFQNFKENSR